MRCDDSEKIYMTLSPIRKQHATHGNRPSTVGLLVMLSLAAMFGTAQAAEVSVGKPAPDFELVDQHNKPHRMGDYRGRWLVMYFYPKADTPGCTTEACEFRDDVFILRRMNVALLGVSTDDVKTQKEFSDKYHLPFPLLSDADGSVATRYGSYSSFGPFSFAKRHTFIVDPQGNIAKVYRDVRPKVHSDQVIADLRQLGAE